MSGPTLTSIQSTVGKAAIFRTADEEVSRIITHQKNYYIVLKVLQTFNLA